MCLTADSIKFNFVFGYRRSVPSRASCKRWRALTTARSVNSIKPYYIKLNRSLIHRFLVPLIVLNGRLSIAKATCLSSSCDSAPPPHWLWLRLLYSAIGRALNAPSSAFIQWTVISSTDFHSLAIDWITMRLKLTRLKLTWLASLFSKVVDTGRDLKQD